MYWPVYQLVSHNSKAVEGSPTAQQEQTELPSQGGVGSLTLDHIFT